MLLWLLCVINDMKLSLEGHGGEIIIGKLNDNEILDKNKKDLS